LPSLAENLELIQRGEIGGVESLRLKGLRLMAEEKKEEQLNAPEEESKQEEPDEIAKESTVEVEEEAATAEEEKEEESVEILEEAEAEKPTEEKKPAEEEEAKPKREKKKEEEEFVEERVYTIPLGQAWAMPQNKRAAKAIRIIRAFVQRHMKMDKPKKEGEVEEEEEPSRLIISNEVNEKVWSRGIEKPPRKIRVRAAKDEDGNVMVFLAEGD